MPDPGISLTEVKVDVLTLSTTITGAADESFKLILPVVPNIIAAMEKKIRQDCEHSASLKAQANQGKTVSRTKDEVKDEVKDEALDVEKPETKKLKL